ncbi:MAG: Hsp20/alpha crystallin family protein [Deltaproteobacteria bacterium]|nr:Hsp20/alpha crystallin family protein [Deltaproteobacteria bacterium]MBF0525844.1 Hsp20/alpha crystallin family protein [Deltaproteobacteria bacterium]
MAILKWTHRPFGVDLADDFIRLQREMNRLLSAAGGRPGVNLVRTSGVYPALNLSEDAENLYLRAELPGIEPEQIDLSIEGDSLTIRGQRTISEADKKVNYHRRERESGYFRRVLTLPSPIDHTKVAAAAKNGVLTITLPKAEAAKPRQIKVAAA